MPTTTFGEFYNTGTVALTASGTTVTGTGVLWTDIERGDILEAQGRQATIDSINDDGDEITLMLPWAGTTASGVAYVIRKDSKARFDPALTQAKVREFLAQLDDFGPFYVFSGAEGTEPESSIGENGQNAFNSETFELWVKSAGVWEFVGTLLTSGGPIGAPPYPVANPSSGNFWGPGYPNPGYLRSDQNARINADVIEHYSSDPSAAIVVNLDGTVTAGDVITTHFHFAGNDIAIPYTVQPGDSYDGGQVVSGIISAIAHNATMFTLNGGTVTGGVVTPAAGKTYGGYDDGAQIGFIVITSGRSYAFDYNSTVPMKMSYTVSGPGGGETMTFPAGFLNNTLVNGGSTPGVQYDLPNSWDNNPVRVNVRQVAGMAPPKASIIWAEFAAGSQSSNPGPVGVNYGAFTHWVGNSTTGALQSAWLLQSTAPGGFLNGGLWVGLGAYTNEGGAPFDGTATVDMGVGTFNAGVAYWLDGVHKIDYAGSQMRIIPATGFSFVLSSDGFGYAATPTNNTFTSGKGVFITGNEEPTGGAGLSVRYGSGQGTIKAYDYTTGPAYKPLEILSSILVVSPSAVQANGFQVQSNNLFPTTDNAFFLGASTFRFAETYSVAFIGSNLQLKGSTSGTATIQAPAVAGTTTITLPGATTNLSTTGGTSHFLKQSTAGGAITSAQPTFADIASGSQATLAQLPSIANNTLLGNSSGSSAVPAAQTLGATLAFVGGALQTVAHTGDVTTSANSFATTIAANAVTYAKFQQVAASSLVGNATASLANATGITLGATLAFSGSALQTAAHTGDVTTSANSFATTIAANAVTYAKFQQVAAVSLVGNATGSTANATGITLGATLAFSGSALQTVAHTGDVTTSANSFATTVAKIQGVTVSGTTGTVNVAFSASPTFTGTLNAAAITASGAVSAGSIACNGNLGLSGDLIASKSGILAIAFTSTANVIQITYSSVGGASYYFQDTAAGSNQKYFAITSGSGSTVFRDLTDVGGVQHPFLTMNHSTGATTVGGLLTTAASTSTVAGLRVPSGTAPSSPTDGDMWYDGTNVKFRVGGTTKTFTLT